MIAEKNAGRVVLLPLADDDLAADVHEVEHSVDRIARRAVRQLLFAAAEPRDGIESRIFCRAHEFKFNRAFGIHRSQ